MKTRRSRRASTLESYMLNRLLSRRLKRTKNEAKPSHKSPEIIVEILHSNNTSSRLRGLIDSGSTGCIVRNEFIGDAHLRKQTTSQWTTKGGSFTMKVLTPLGLLELQSSSSRTSQWLFDSLAFLIDSLVLLGLPSPASCTGHATPGAQVTIFTSLRSDDPL